MLQLGYGKVVRGCNAGGAPSGRTMSSRVGRNTSASEATTFSNPSSFPTRDGLLGIVVERHGVVLERLARNMIIEVIDTYD